MNDFIISGGISFIVSVIFVPMVNNVWTKSREKNNFLGTEKRRNVMECMNLIEEINFTIAIVFIYDDEYLKFGKISEKDFLDDKRKLYFMIRHFYTFLNVNEWILKKKKSKNVLLQLIDHLELVSKKLYQDSDTKFEPSTKLFDDCINVLKNEL